MNVFLAANGREQLPGDLMVRWVLRSDLAPVPRTVELTLQDRDGLMDRLPEGASFWTGRELMEYRVIKVEKHKPAPVVQGNDQLSVFSVTALLASCAEIAYRRERAVITDSASIGEVYRSCGASVAIADDIRIPRFACFAGQVPSYMIAKVLQEESAALVIRNGRLSITRLAELARQPAKVTLVQDSADLVQSEFLERHEIPGFFSLSDDGSFVMGDFSNARTFQYMPRSEESTLRNASRVLVTKRIVSCDLDQTINAGDVIRVGGRDLVVITAAHVMESVSARIQSVSKLWAGEVSA
jgi:hypothetical protein